MNRRKTRPRIVTWPSRRGLGRHAVRALDARSGEPLARGTVGPGIDGIRWAYAYNVVEEFYFDADGKPVTFGTYAAPLGE